VDMATRTDLVLNKRPGLEGRPSGTLVWAPERRATLRQRILPSTSHAYYPLFLVDSNIQHARHNAPRPSPATLEDRLCLPHFTHNDCRVGPFPLATLLPRSCARISRLRTTSHLTLDLTGNDKAKEMDILPINFSIFSVESDSRRSNRDKLDFAPAAVYRHVSRAGPTSPNAFLGVVS
jgi:hypothetical protein